MNFPVNIVSGPNTNPITGLPNNGVINMNFPVNNATVSETDLIPDLPDLTDDTSLQENELKQALTIKQIIKQANKEDMERENQKNNIIMRHKEIDSNKENTSLKNELNEEFIYTGNNIKPISEYINTINKAIDNNITLDFDTAIVNAIIDVTRSEEVIDYLMNFTTKQADNILKFGKRNDNFSNYVYKLIKTNKLSDRSYEIIEKYGEKENMALSRKAIKTKLQNEGITVTTPSVLRPDTNENMIGNMSGGGMWQQGGFFMTCS